MFSKCREIVERTAKMGTAAVLAALVLLVMAVPAWADNVITWSGEVSSGHQEINSDVKVVENTTLTIENGMFLTIHGKIYIEEGKTLTVTGYGLYVEGNAESENDSNGDDGITGKGSLIIDGATVGASGGNGKDGANNGGNGGHGGNGVSCEGGVKVVNGGSLYANGGNGGEGIDGSDGNDGGDGNSGGNGGRGGTGIRCTLTVINGEVEATGGEGGTGGDGGDGGDGVNDGNGGNGGCGGDGGNGGDGINGKLIAIGGETTVEAGDGNGGGEFGAAGNGDNEGEPGGNGNDGDDGNSGTGITGEVTLSGGTLKVDGGSGASEDGADGVAFGSGVTAAAGYIYSDEASYDLTGNLEAASLGGKTLRPVLAEIGTARYLSLEEAFDNAAEGDTLRLLCDSTTNSTITITKGTEQKPVTLDLNGHGICFEGESDDRRSVIKVGSGAALTLKDTATTKPIHKIAIGEDGFTTAVETVSAAGTDTDTEKYVAGGYLTGGYADEDQVGGGVTIDENAVFTMTGGTICGNSTSREGTAGGVFVCDDAKFTMTGGTICGNTDIKDDEYGGGGVRSNGTFNMSGGRITENTANLGGGVYVRSGTFTMSGTADIADNTAENHGGGVYVNEGTFQMKGGRITENTGKSEYSEGGGVFVSISGTFTMTNGEITGNSADSRGGGVCLEDGDEDDHATFNISGDAKVTDNTAGGAKSNVCRYDDGITIITVTGTLTGELGVSTVKWDNDKDKYVPTTGVITSGLDGKGSDLNFFSDSDGYAVGLNDNKEAVLAGTPVTITFDANGGSGTMASRKVPKGVKATLSANSFNAPANAEFTGWNTKADGSGTSYNDKATITISADTTLYAQWKKKPVNPVDPEPGKKDEKISESTIPGGTGKIVVNLTTDDNGDTGYSVKNVAIPVDLAVSLLSEDEKKAVMGGETLSVTLEVSEIKGSAMSEQDKKDAEKAGEAVKEKTGLASAGNGMILDIKLFKQVGTGDKKEVEPTAGTGKVSFTVEVPAYMVNTDGSIIRTFFLVHILDNGTAVIVNSGTGTAIPAETDSFSSWYLTYVDERKDNGGNEKPAEKVITVPDNQPAAYSEETKGDFRIGYFHEIPFFGKAKPDLKLFGEITVSYNGATYKASKIKVNKKKCLIQITGLEGADKDTVKAVKKATKGASGLSFKVNPYFVKDTDAVTPKFKKDGSLKSVKVKINGKDYKAKKGEFSYDADSKTVTFTGDNLNGSHKLS